MKTLLLNVCVILLAVSTIQAQETEVKKGDNQKREKLYFKVKGDTTLLKGHAKPDIYVDGKKFDFDLELLDQDKIESIVIIKDEQALKEYNAPNGVVLIKTKKINESNNSKIKSAGAIGSETAPMIIIDGELVSGKETLKKLSPDEIEDIKILKGEQAMEKHNAPNGVIIITTKKGKRGKRRKR